MKKKLGRTVFHILATLTGILFLLVLSLHLYLNLNGTQIFTSCLDKVLNKEERIYIIKHNSIDIDLLGGQLVLKNLRISFDEKKLKQSGLDRARFFKASIPFLSIRGVSFSDLILFRKISAERVLLKGAELKLYFRDGKGEKRGPPEKLPAFSLGGVIIENMDIEFYTESSPLPKSGLKGVRLDTGKLIFHPGRKSAMRELPDFHFSVKKSFMDLRKTGYRIETGPVWFDSGGSTIRGHDLSYQPLSPGILKQKMMNEGRYHKFNIPEISMRQIDFRELKDRRRLKAGQLYIHRPEIFLYRNRNLNRNPGRKAKELPQQIFRESSLKADVDLVRIKKGKIKYTEIAVGESRGESLTFNDLQVSFHDISNFPEIIRDGRESEIQVSTRLMGESLFKGKIRIPVNHRADRFFFSGALEKTNPAIFNRFLKRNVKIRIDRGKINYLNFNVNADRDRAEGTMQMSYNNAYITVMRKKNSSKKSRFATFLANTLTHKHNPTRPKRKLRIGKIRFERKEKRSIFNYMWKCILTGIKSSIKI